MNYFKQLLTVSTLTLGLIAQPALAVVESGPVQLLQIEAWYQNTTSNVIYIQFKLNGAMPGCYASRGGYLAYTEPNFDRHYAVLMTLLAKGSINGAVLFEKNGSPTGNWGDCNIKGLYLAPQ
jgi:hypothetical protein